MAQKYFQANLQTLERLRVARGWSREQLAAKAIVSTRTLDSIMAGKQAVLFTFSKLAKALDTPVTEIVDGFEEPKPRGDRRYTVTITISAPYDEYDEAKDLPEFLQKLLSRVGGDQIWGVEAKAGSVEIRFCLTEEQHAKLIAALEAGTLGDLDIVRMDVHWDANLRPDEPTLYDDIYPEGELPLDASDWNNDAEGRG
jgi:transcriptional regulator with XRE-family HTH domain